MAFNKQFFQPIGGQALAGGSGYAAGIANATTRRAPQVWSYLTADDHATVDGSGYFAAVRYLLEIGDTIQVSVIDANGALQSYGSHGVTSKTATAVRSILANIANGGGRLQIVANRGVTANSLRQGNAGGRTDVVIENRHQLLIGRQPVSGLRAGITGFYLLNSGETLLGNDFTWEAGLELTSPVMTRPGFVAAQQFITVPTGIPFVLTDPIGYDLAAGASLYLRQGMRIANEALFFQAGTGNLSDNDTAFISPSVVSQVQSTGAMTSPAGGSAWGSEAYGFLLGIPAAPMPAVIIVGDSIADGSGEDVPASGHGDAKGNKGFIARGLEDVNGYDVPYLKQAASGSVYSVFGTLLASSRCRTMWPFATHIIFEHGSNDVNGGRTLAQMQADATAAWTSAKRTIGPYGLPLKTAGCSIMPRTTSTDSWATGANQTPVAGFEPNGICDQFNAWQKAQVGGGLLDAYINSRAYVEDPLVPGAWITNGSANYPTADGIHPKTALHILAAQAVNAYALTMTAP